MKKNLILV